MSVMIVNGRERLPIDVYDTSHQQRFTAAGGALRICSQGGLPGVLLEFNELATFARVDSENHALLAMPSLAAVEPHRVRVFHSVLHPREGFLVFCNWHKASVESAIKGRARGVERGLCHCVVLLLEDEIDGIAGCGRYEGRVVLDESIWTTRHDFELSGVCGQSGQKTEHGGERNEFREHD